MPVLNTYLASPFRLLLGIDPIRLHMAQIDDRIRDVGAGQLPDLEHVT